MKWEDLKKEVKSISDAEKKVIELFADLELEYDEEKIQQILDIIER
jgi:hypothetical protein